MYQLGLVGNCQVSGLINQHGGLTWLCMPRPDSAPVFGDLLDSEGGTFTVCPVDHATIHQRYRTNTAILESEWTLSDEQKFKITDFCPRFEQHGRMYRPAAFFRIVEPISGFTRIKVKFKPIKGWSKDHVRAQRGNSHLRFPMDGGVLRLVTNMPLTYLLSEQEFLLQEPLYFAVLWDMPLEDDLKQVATQFLDKTESYWRTWVKHASIPSLFQGEVIRSAITLKLHCYEDTGAVLAATTTSLPEHPGAPRNWDYRYCWLRDTFFTLSALFHLSHFEEMEGFLHFVMNIVDYQKDLAPVYTIDKQLPIPEQTMENWEGYQDSRPVRIRNAAATQVQNDVYGELVLTLAPIYRDERFHHLRNAHLEKMLLWLGDKCIQSIGQPDAGLWELRGLQQEHTFTNIMCWAGLDRIVKILALRPFPSAEPLALNRFKQHRERAAARIRAAVKDGIVRNGPEDDSFDASVLLLPILGYPDRELCLSTTIGIAAALGSEVPDSASSYLYRYKRQDDFGKPESAFLICSFWLAQAWAVCGCKDKGLRVLDQLKECANSLGLLPEHWDNVNKRHLGNFPQTYSHVGLINAAFAASPAWIDVL
ncbi:MAG: glycoside hydrolase family 15 protein [Chitinophagaceae bacterium]|nr:glycoside hydrolase family 15 protein [Oligoflexus sp.]